ncbi:A-kinase anchoring protein 7 isoform X3 [Ahaetulla prasina]|uniref:A-kinase anchoring protein 7 isoform X3 n=1 Tax=Ahaetulla prasina TaxID=499056 RepID=UPI002648BB8F|nr:A-kinase anchoring protein 7 isoform X3 [Ahaetulla prasina]
MISKLPRLFFRTLRSVRFAAGSAGSSSPQIPWAPPEVGRRSLFSGAVMAAQGSSPLRADSQRLEAEEKEEEEEAGRGGMGGKVQPPTASKQLSQQIASSKSKPSVKKKRKRIAGKGNEEDSTITKKKKNQDRPNYFISVPITNPKIIDGIQTLQNTIIEKDNRLSKAMIHYGSFHVTLLVMHLSNEEAISNGVGAFLESGGLIEELLQGKPLNLSFQGTDHFRNQIGFVKLTEGDNTTTLLKIAEIVKKMFQEKGIVIDDKILKPHLTFMKLSKSPKLQKQGVKRIDSSMFANFKNHHFGDELMSRLDLCSMLKKKQPNGYYHCESSIVVGDKKGAEPDDAELLSLSKKLVETAVLKAVQQYLEETQNKNIQNDCGTPVKTEEVAIGNSKESENDIGRK